MIWTRVTVQPPGLTTVRELAGSGDRPRALAMLGLGLAVLTGLAGCGGSGVAPSPRPPQQVTMVYESGARPADPIDGWIWQSDATGRNAEP